MAEFQKLLDHLRKTLSPARYAHTVAVAGWAKKLAAIHGVSPEKAWRAGLLHDLAKELPGPALVKHVRDRRLAVPGLKDILARKLFGLLHAHVSADLAAREWGEKDAEVLAAVAAHTLGGMQLAPLAKILYVADFSSPDRRFAAAAALRRTARKDLDAAFRQAVAGKIRYVLEGGGFLHPLTVAMWNA